MTYDAVVTTISASEARATLPGLLDRVGEGAEITITRHGRAVAVVVRPDVLRSRRASRAFAEAARVHELMTAGPTGPIPGEGLDPAWAEELVAEVRAGRDAR